ncbi:MAG: energy transducer TonB [Burkholderiaceae bacterium]
MSALADRFEFMPPDTGGRVRGFGLALLAHGCLVAALTWGVQWKSAPSTAAAQAELWAALPPPAAPKPAEVVPTPAPPPTPPVAAPTPPPAPAPAAPPPPVAVRPPDIALEREKQKKLLDEKKAQQAQAEKVLQQQAAQKKLEAQKALDVKAAQTKAAEAKRQEAAAAQAKQQEEQLKKLREDNLRRIAGLAGAAGSAPQATVLSDSYQALIQARIQPYIVVTEDLPKTLLAIVQVRAAPDGTITSRTLIKSSGNRVWDDAVLKAIDKTDALPRNVDGRVPSPLDIGFRPRN